MDKSWSCSRFILSISPLPCLNMCGSLSTSSLPCSWPGLYHNPELLISLNLNVQLLVCLVLKLWHPLLAWSVSTGSTCVVHSTCCTKKVNCWRYRTYEWIGCWHCIVDWFRCNEFDSNASDLSKWWLLADNYEAEILTIVGMFMFINNAAVFSFGYKFRRAIFRNYPMLFLWALYIAIVSYWTLADPNRFGCLFRINCGTPQVLEDLGYPVPPTYIEQYNSPLGHNIMPWDFRWRLWGLCVGNMATTLIYERFVVLGPVHTYLAKKFPVNRLVVTR